MRKTKKYLIVILALKLAMACYISTNAMEDINISNQNKIQNNINKDTAADNIIEKEKEKEKEDQGKEEEKEKEDQEKGKKEQIENLAVTEKMEQDDIFNIKGKENEEEKEDQEKGKEDQEKGKKGQIENLAVTEKMEQDDIFNIKGKENEEEKEKIKNLYINKKTKRDKDIQVNSTKVKDNIIEKEKKKKEKNQEEDKKEQIKNSDMNKKTKKDKEKDKEKEKELISDNDLKKADPTLTLVTFEGKCYDDDLKFLFNKIYEFTFYLAMRELFVKNKHLLIGYDKFDYKETEKLDFNILIFNENLASKNGNNVGDMCKIIKDLSDRLRESILKINNINLYDKIKESQPSYTFQDVKDQVEYFYINKNYLKLDNEKKSRYLELLDKMQFADFQEYCSNIKVGFETCNYKRPEKPNSNEVFTALKEGKKEFEVEMEFDNFVSSYLKDNKTKLIYANLFSYIFSKNSKIYTEYKDNVEDVYMYSLDVITSLINYKDNFKLKKDKDKFIKYLIEEKDRIIKEYILKDEKDSKIKFDKVKDDFLRFFNEEEETIEYDEIIKGITLENFREFVECLTFSWEEEIPDYRNSNKILTKEFVNSWSPHVDFVDASAVKYLQGDDYKYYIDDVYKKHTKYTSLTIESPSTANWYNYLFKYIFFKTNEELFKKYRKNVVASFQKNHFQNMVTYLSGINSDILIFNPACNSKQDCFSHDYTGFDEVIDNIKSEFLQAIQSTLDNMQEIWKNYKSPQANELFNRFKNGCIDFVKNFSGYDDERKKSLIDGIKNIEIDRFNDELSKINVKSENFMRGTCNADKAYALTNFEKWPYIFYISFEKEFNIYYLFFTFIFHELMKEDISKDLLKSRANLLNSSNFSFFDVSGNKDLDKMQRYFIEFSSFKENKDKDIFKINCSEYFYKENNILKESYGNIKEKLKTLSGRYIGFNDENRQFERFKENFKNYLSKNRNLFKDSENVGKYISAIDKITFENFFSFIKTNNVLNKMKVANVVESKSIKELNRNIFCCKLSDILEDILNKDKKSINIESLNKNIVDSFFVEFDSFHVFTPSKIKVKVKLNINKKTFDKIADNIKLNITTGINSYIIDKLNQALKETNTYFKNCREGKLNSDKFDIEFNDLKARAIKMANCKESNFEEIIALFKKEHVNTDHFENWGDIFNSVEYKMYCKDSKGVNDKDVVSCWSTYRQENSQIEK